jgi:hypothetical protein
MDRRLLLRLQSQALQYFLDNQTADGLLLDRQRNHGPPSSRGLCSTAATGMGWIALALASAEPYHRLSHSESVQRVRIGVESALNVLPHDRGIMPHFLDSRTGQVCGTDQRSTIDSAWLTAGALWAAAFLRDSELERLATAVYERIDWYHWTNPGASPTPMLRHGQTRDGEFIPCAWDRLNGETVFMYVLAAGAVEHRAVPASVWRHLRSFHGTTASLHFNNSDLGLFVFQYGMDLLDLEEWMPPGEADLAAEAAIAVEANRRVCRELARRFATYRHYWGLSAGDGPGERPEESVYRCYSPAGPIDGTGHLTATLASIAHQPERVLENLQRAVQDPQRDLLGRYGFSNVNVDREWIGSDMIGIDAGAAFLALDNFLNGSRIRSVFHALPCVQRGVQRAGFRSRTLQAVRAA